MAERMTIVDSRPLDIVLANEALLSAENVMLRAEVQRLQYLLMAACELHAMDEKELARLRAWRDRVTGSAKKVLSDG